MKIILDKVGKRFNREWLYRDIVFEFLSGATTAITGSNGSGKSTLLKIISGAMPPTEGKIKYIKAENIEVETDDVFQYVSLAAPYLELIEEYTLVEMVNFHFKFKKPIDDSTTQSIIYHAYFSNEKNKLIKHFSSGMKQRLKLALALFSDTPILLLDEPTTNLDTKGKQWFREAFEKNTRKRLVIMASNQEDEFNLCEKIMAI